MFKHLSYLAMSSCFLQSHVVLNVGRHVWDMSHICKRKANIFIVWIITLTKRKLRHFFWHKRWVIQTHKLFIYKKVFIKSEKFESLPREFNHKYYVRGYGPPYPNYGHLYTITPGPGANTNSGDNPNQERTYDEPCIDNDLPRSRSWLCCPGSQSESQPPPLLPPANPTLGGNVLPNSTSTEEGVAITKAPAVGGICSHGCVCFLFSYI